MESVLRTRDYQSTKSSPAPRYLLIRISSMIVLRFWPAGWGARGAWGGVTSSYRPRAPRSRGPNRACPSTRTSRSPLAASRRKAGHSSEQTRCGNSFHRDPDWRGRPPTRRCTIFLRSTDGADAYLSNAVICASSASLSPEPPYPLNFQTIFPDPSRRYFIGSAVTANVVARLWKSSATDHWPAGHRVELSGFNPCMKRQASSGDCAPRNPGYEGPTSIDRIVNPRGEYVVYMDWSRPVDISNSQEVQWAPMKSRSTTCPR